MCAQCRRYPILIPTGPERLETTCLRITMNGKQIIIPYMATLIPLSDREQIRDFISFS